MLKVCLSSNSRVWTARIWNLYSDYRPSMFWGSDVGPEDGHIFFSPKSRCLPASRDGVAPQSTRWTSTTLTCPQALVERHEILDLKFTIHLWFLRARLNDILMIILSCTNHGGNSVANSQAENSRDLWRRKTSVLSLKWTSCNCPTITDVIKENMSDLKISFSWDVSRKNLPDVSGGANCLHHRRGKSHFFQNHYWSVGLVRY